MAPSRRAAALPIHLPGCRHAISFSNVPVQLCAIDRYESGDMHKRRCWPATLLQHGHYLQPGRTNPLACYRQDIYYSFAPDRFRCGVLKLLRMDVFFFEM